MKHHPLPPSPVEPYPLSSDGGLIYNPISRAKADQLGKYDAAEAIEGEMHLSVRGVDYHLTYRAPRAVTAYDAMPIDYRITASKPCDLPVHLSAEGFTEPERIGAPCYELTLPGTVDLTWQYEGYVGGDDRVENRPVVSADPERDRLGKRFPQYDTTELIRSGQVGVHDTVWFRFAYENTGNTVLDGDGGGTFCFEAQLFALREGRWERIGKLENLFHRLIEPLYPGEKGNCYFTFSGFHRPAPGSYQIRIYGLVRNETEHPERYETKIWHGHIATASSFTFTVGADEIVEPSPMVKDKPGAQLPRNRYLHRYEEFMTSFDSHLGGVGTGVEGRMYLQTAPFTRGVTLRLTVGDEDALAMERLDVAVESDSLHVTFNPENRGYVRLKDGSRYPAVSAQSMADMRGNSQLGPDGAYRLLDNLLAMQQCGVNLINTTAAFEFDPSFSERPNNNIDACWFSLEAARALGIKLQGWIAYPYEDGGAIPQANALFGTSFREHGFGAADHALAHAANAVWQYERWGDNYFLGDGGEVVMDVEDTRGWMRVDFNARHRFTSASMEAFRGYLAEKYGSIEALNEAWESDYASFDEIDPERDTVDDHGYAGYRVKGHPFEEWSLPLADLDEFRCIERLGDYRTLLDQARKTVPTAAIHMRTEGGNFPATVDPATTVPHLRHVYYSARRCGFDAKALGESGLVHSVSDYVTLPYTPREVAELTRSCLSLGLLPMMLPQFDRMRDIAINTRYGNDFTYEYNLSGDATKGCYLSTVISVYEWYKATYENGGVPGILWQDYLCDGYATSTQRKEIAFFSAKLAEAMESEEAMAWRQSAPKGVELPKGKRSYGEELVEEEIARVRRMRGE